MKSWMQKITTPSRAFAALAAAFCVGVLIGGYGSWSFIWTMVALIFFLFATGVSRRFRLGILIAVFLLTGVLRSQFATPHLEFLPWEQQEDQSFTVEGHVVGEVEKRINGSRVTLQNVTVDSQVAPTNLHVYLPMGTEVQTADGLSFECKVRSPEPFEGFQYDKFLLAQDVRGVCFSPQDIDVFPAEGRGLFGGILQVKAFLVDKLERIAPEPHAGFLTGLIFGGSSSLSSDIKNAVSVTGVSHILAASGFNVSLFTFVFLQWVMQTPLGRRKGILLTVILLVVYVIMAGMTPAVLRAAFMASLILLGSWVRRPTSIPNVLLAALALMLLVNPLWLFYDVGFQLSFVATAAILWLAPKLEPAFRWVPEVIGFRESLVGSLAAIILTLPILLWHFGTVSLIAPIANLLILPVVPYIMGWTIMGLAAGLFWIELGRWIILPAWGLSLLVLQMVEWLSHVPHAEVTPGYTKEIAVLITCLFIGGWAAFHKRRHI